jgi:Double zinc ribbon
MNQTTCPYCQEHLPDRAIFCGACGQQARCTSCREILELNARVCIICGTPASEHKIMPTDHGDPVLHSGINTLQIEENKTGRSLRASLTDAAVDSLSGPLGMFVAGHIDGAMSRDRRVPVHEAMVINNEQRVLPDTVPDGEASSPPTAIAPPLTSPQTDAVKLRRVFCFNSDQLRLDNTHLKATSKSDAAQRLTYLFLICTSG